MENKRGYGMRINPVTTPEAVRERLLKLIDECESFSWASAWVTKSIVFDAAIRARKKISHFVIGTHQYFTDSDCLDACLKLPCVRVTLPDGTPLFHPKVYAFRLAEHIELYVGSSNLTGAGLTRNIECGVFLSAERGNPQLNRFFEFIEKQWADADKIDEDFIASYRANQVRTKDAVDDLLKFIRIKKPKRSSQSAQDVDPNGMDWNTFVKLVRKDKTHGLENRLETLLRARQLFASGRSFADFTWDEQKCIAGILKPQNMDGVDWGFFGQMSSYGLYSPILRIHGKGFSKALDHIPLIGAVKRKHYDAYLDAFNAIPGASKSWLGMGTRLLTMKRPDHFVCINNPNRVGLCGYFSTAYSTTNLSNYWERIIEPMEVMPWWQSEIPEDEVEQKIWMGRAAMLDAIYYDPAQREK